MIKTSLQVETYLRDLGLNTGDKVLIHADLRVFGRLEGNGSGLLTLIKDIVGRHGLICTQVLHFHSQKILILRIVNLISDL